jgi:undecaprenyl pyrophosphate phosphatase UppP
MTTFQILIQSLLSALTLPLPLSSAPLDALSRDLLEWSLPMSEIEALTLCMASLAFLIFFRFDWLGLLSAAISSVVRPMSLRTDSRSLDQHTLIFLLLAFLPVRVLAMVLGPVPLDAGFGSKSLFAGIALVLTGFGFFASARWNKRIHGLNHLRISHVLGIAAAGALSLLPGFPPVGLLWIAFAFCNYHYESIFKFSAILVGLGIFTRTYQILEVQGIRDAVEKLGYLNSAAGLVIAFSVLWISLDHLQKTLSESTFKNFQWLNLLAGSAMVALYFAGILSE